MPAPANLIHETSTTTGTGNLTVVAVNGKVRFSDSTYGFGTGGSDAFWYFISNQAAAEWEIGTGSMSDANTLVRDTILFSSNSNNAVDFSAGTKDVTNDIPAANQNLALPGVNGLVITNNSGTPTTSIDIDADNAVLVNTSGDGIRTGAVNLTVACAGTGANGLDAGSLANNTWYHIYIISNGTTTAGLASTSATAPTMPSGYTYKYRVGAVRTLGAATFIRVRQVGKHAQYTVVASSTTPNYPIMDSGTAGNISTPTWEAVATGSYVPPTATRILGMLGGSGGAAVIGAPNNAAGAWNSSTNPPPVARDNNAVGVQFDFILESTNIYWASDAADGYIVSRGWVDAVNA